MNGLDNRSLGYGTYQRLVGRAERYGPELRVLIVGGGVAGLTLAALLEQRGFSPTVVERSGRRRGAGYAIGLWPAGSRILKGLGIFRRFEAIGVECPRYVVATESGEILHSYSLDEISAKHGPVVNVSRADLIGLLEQALSDRCIRFGTTVREIVMSPRGASVRFNDDTADVFDVVVGCDGVRSTMRQLVFGRVSPAYTGLTGWALWIESPFVPPCEVTEYWGAGKLVATYPMRDRVCVILAARLQANTPDPTETRLERLGEHFAGFGGSVPWILSELSQARDVYHDDFSDLQLEHWHSDRVVLIGDAAYGSLPLDAMGASLAMESAAVLAEELCRTDSSHVAIALERYVARRRPRVDRVRAQSRRLCKVMFAGGRVLTRLRNSAVRHSADDVLLGELDTMLAERL
ncbi:MAG TPA: NAD(P)/FAD-dependent oxidoreductase [Gemmatimonadaceae bacterium]|nr:NAD(P)/FAD-dependent oxidoreductase [Gemmatimonadaceae bacterium]